ncbi:alpha/beta fold hydrolase [Streptomyces cinnabarinus]|uniref:Alpha/beta fold hydrolase n=1 Tax=Streptomyces cinnabarinus TaxID=67287 RepID=A0ABY7KBF8_9ACTN|nr:alpha/beta fold hydrolase [Streptomyces cinnabarinus]WAZ21840.1 alpha/beta fold hydrolase [Streptomyces cinnabarinus]
MEPTHLICLPFGGAGASFFKDWQQSAPDGLTVLPVQLPGREERFIEPAHTAAGPAVDEAFSWVLDRIGGSGRVALFGHSLGAVLAYELAHRLASVDGVHLVRLIVSGSPAPWNGRTERATGLDDEGFLEQLRRFTGYVHPALEAPEMRELLLPTLRADVQLHEDYRPSTEKPLAAPITALRGRDDTLVDAARLAGWAEATTAGLDTVEVDGGHMYLAHDQEPLLRQILTALA